jgi:hypothetical protein
MGPSPHHARGIEVVGDDGSADVRVRPDDLGVATVRFSFEHRAK